MCKSGCPQVSYPLVLFVNIQALSTTTTLISKTPQSFGENFNVRKHTRCLFFVAEKMLLYEKSEDKNLAQNIPQHKFYCAGSIDICENIF